MASNCNMYDFLDNDKLERYFDDRIEEGLCELKSKYQ